ncbi:MAG: PEP/pyruvate-binding domain-containing protein [Desulfitobacteriaceae bacterium]
MKIISWNCNMALERPVAVRSSAIAEDSDKASFAGIHESFLNVRNMDNILTAIKGCIKTLSYGFICFRIGTNDKF